MSDPQPFDQVMEQLRGIPVDPVFRPRAFYNRDGDTLEIYLRRDSFIVERINSFISAFVSTSDPSQIVGLAIKKIREHFGSDPNLRFLFQTGRATIKLLVMGTLTKQEWDFVRGGIKPDVLSKDRQGLLGQLLFEAAGEVEVDLPELALN